MEAENGQVITIADLHRELTNPLEVGSRGFGFRRTTKRWGTGGLSKPEYRDFHRDCHSMRFAALSAAEYLRSTEAIEKNGLVVNGRTW